MDGYERLWDNGYLPFWRKLRRTFFFFSLIMILLVYFYNTSKQPTSSHLCATAPHWGWQWEQQDKHIIATWQVCPWISRALGNHSFGADISERTPPSPSPAVSVVSCEVINSPQIGIFSCSVCICALSPPAASHHWGLHPCPQPSPPPHQSPPLHLLHHLHSYLKQHSQMSLCSTNRD